MQRMIWTANGRMGFEEVDSQHRLLYAIANELLEIENPASQEQEIKYLLRHLRSYIDSHFKSEEELMAKHNYQGLPTHKQKHEKIIGEMKEALTSSKSLTQLKSQLEDLLIGWIQSHILIEDKRFSDWAKLHKII